MSYFLRWLALCTVTALACETGCAHIEPATEGADQLHAIAYLSATVVEGGCSTGDRTACCAQLTVEAKQAADAGDEPEAARRYHHVAAWCPRQRRAATLAAVPVRTNKPAVGTVAARVSFRAQLPPELRLYWFSASTGYTLLPAQLPPRVHVVDFEIHVMAVSGPGEGQVSVIKQSIPVDFSQTNRKHLDLRVRTPSVGAAPEFDLVWLGPDGADTPPVRDGAGPTPASTSPEPRHRAHVVTEPEALSSRSVSAAPELDFPAGPGPLYSACVDKDGSFRGAVLLTPVHPRVAGLLLDAFARMTWRPAQADGVPFVACTRARLWVLRPSPPLPSAWGSGHPLMRGR